MERLEERALLSSIGISAGNNALVSGSNLTVSVDNGTYTINDTTGLFVVMNFGTATVTGAGTNTLTVTGIVSLDIHASNADDTINLRSTDVPTKIDTGIGSNDVVSVGSLAPAMGGNLLGIAAELTVDDPDSGTLNMDDSGDPTGRTIVVAELPAATTILVTGLPGITFGVNVQTTNFFGGTGDDVFTGGSFLAPDEVNFFGGGGNDVLFYLTLPLFSLASFDGGTGINRIDYSLVPVMSPEGINVNLQAGTATLPPSIANIQQVVGSPGDDTLIGSDGSETISGGGGNDTIQGLGGADVLNGDDGDDTIDGGPGNDILTAGNGNDNLAGGPDSDTIDAGTGNDLVVWNDGDGSDVVNGGSGNTVMQVNGSQTATGDQFTVVSQGLAGQVLQFSRTNLVPFTLQLSLVSQLQVNSLDGDDTLTLDLANGFPIPMGDPIAPGVLFDGGPGTGDRLVFVKSAGSFPGGIGDESYTAIGPEAGNFFFSGGMVAFQNLTRVIDTVPAASLVFNGPTGAAAINVTDGPLIGGVATTTIASGDTPASFAAIDFANKTEVVANLAAGTDAVVLDSPKGSTGLGSLEVAFLGSETDQVTVMATPPGVGTFVIGGNGPTVVDVNGAGVGAGGSLTILAGDGFSTLRYDAGGGLAAAAPGPQSGEATITLPGSGSVIFESVDLATIVNSASPPTVGVTPAPTINGVEGRALIDAVVAQFNADSAGSAGQFDVTIAWGDGSLPVTGVVAQGLSNAALYSAAGSHAYPLPGTYTTTVTIRDRGGEATMLVAGMPVTTVRFPAATVTSTAATVVVAAAPLLAQGAAVSATTGRDTGPVIVASFQDTGTALPPAGYTATIDWGDGTTSTGTLSPTGSSPAGTTFVVRGDHAYHDAGMFPVSINIASSDGSAAVALGSAVVAKPLAPVGTLKGRLDPRSDTGVSHTDGITRDNTPTFRGTAGPGAIVTLKATRAGGSSSISLGRAVTDAAGNWRINAPLIADGTYKLTASVVGEDGSTTSAALKRIVIDTVAPRVTSAQLDRSGGRVVLGFRDDRSGLDGRSLANGANYAFTKANARPGQFLVTSLAARPPSGLASVVTAMINGGRRLPGGFYTLVVRSGGVQDVAGNALDGAFFGVFPSGNGAPGSNFVARIDSIHNTVFAPAPVFSTVAPAQALAARDAAIAGMDARAIALRRSAR